MKPLSQKVFNNLKSPFRLYRWWGYQVSRKEPHDAILVTLNGAGTHWMRTMLSKALVDLYDLDDEIVSIHQPDLLPTFLNKDHRFKYNHDLNIPRIQQSHSFYSPLFKGKKVVLLIRDLRDTLVSHYKVLQTTKDLDVSFSMFLKGEGFDSKKHHTLKTRIEFLNVWGRSLQHTDLHQIVKFEDLKADTKGNLQQVIEFIGMPDTTDEQLASIVDFASIDNMRTMEQRNPHKKLKGKMEKVRKGKSGGYKEYFNEGDKDYFLETVENNLKHDFGYDFSKW